MPGTSLSASNRDKDCLGSVTESLKQRPGPELASLAAGSSPGKPQTCPDKIRCCLGTWLGSLAVDPLVRVF